MKLLNVLKNRKSLLLAALMGTGMLANAQLKVGDNPTSIQKSSILELESTRQGLLLPRLTDTAAINSLNPPDGMIIYLTADNSLRIRSNNSWKKLASMADATANWSLTGNAGTDSATSFIGTTDGKPFTIRTDNAARMIIGSNGNIGIGTTTPSATLNVNGTVKLENLAAGSTEVDVLVLAADGSVYKRTMSSSAFTNAIKAINGIQKQTLSITAQASTSEDSVKVDSRSSDSTIAIYLPVQDGTSASRPYGFLTHADWDKIQSGIQTITIGAVAASSDVNGATIVTDSTSRKIILHPADATNPGIVTAGAQTFGGSKTFRDSVTVGGTLNLNTVTNNASADSVLVISNGLVSKRKVSDAAFGNAIRRINGNIDTAQVVAFRNTGADLAVVANGADSIYLNVPDAGTAARGVVTTAAQTFGGSKTFQDSVAAAKTFLAGTTGNANSTVQVAGSISMAIKSVNTTYTASATDNTILANTTTAAFTITLPSPTNIAGRIYTIKKVGSGGIDKELTITPTSGTIDGGSSYVIYNDWTYVTLQTDGTDWYIIKK
ncbi:hypothetical protein A4D02_35690 [Niastella koreensis]|uniref:Uncharacterized protein n=2 Tax=Niastella koreensis TaxID=354356 RepID=G8T8R8_NIAKG|nr:hypothetical protein [Niastella koreensis]AEW01248.1 hypothetical protein Niako_5009 [Niastella koreensis GR20-10]OQP44192.1 hypothetical protein A4D02_35690 [Niastella koreensis]